MQQMVKKSASRKTVGADDWIDDAKIKQFSVKDPDRIYGHLIYKCTGVDSKGLFEQPRRFKQFQALGTTLKLRWPGCYIPSFPEKQLILNS